MSHQKIELRFWSNLPKEPNVNLESLVDGVCMELIDCAMNSKKQTSSAQVVEIHRAWVNIKRGLKTGIPTIRTKAN